MVIQSDVSASQGHEPESARRVYQLLSFARSVNKLGKVKGCARSTRARTSRRGLTKNCAAEGAKMEIVAFDADEDLVDVVQVVESKANRARLTQWVDPGGVVEQLKRNDAAVERDNEGTTRCVQAIGNMEDSQSEPGYVSRQDWLETYPVKKGTKELKRGRGNQKR